MSPVIRITRMCRAHAKLGAGTRRVKLRVSKKFQWSLARSSRPGRGPYAASVPGTIAPGPNLSRARSATSSILRDRSSTGSNVS